MPLENNLIIKEHKVDFFGKLPNYLINDINLSANGLAAALYLESKPASWQCRPFDLKKRFGWGDHIWRKVSRELKSHGLLREIKHLDGTALKFIDPWEQFAASPVAQPPVDFRTVQKATSGISTPLDNKEITNKDLLNKKDNMCASGLESKSLTTNKQEKITETEIKQLFDKLWFLYPLKKAKQTALQALIKKLKSKSKADAEVLAMAIGSGLVECVNEHNAKVQLQEQGADIWFPSLPHLATWINQSRWADDYQSADEILMGARKTKGIDLAAREQRLKREGFIT